MQTEAVQVRAKSLAWGVVLVLITLAAYWPAMRHGGFIWDDDDYLTNNATLRAPDALAKVWLDRKASPQYYPLVFTTFWVEKQIWGLDATGYHVVNVLLHAGSAVLVWRILKRLEVPGALLAGAIFAVHPVMVESVAWVTERKNVLAGILFLSSVLAYLRFAIPVNGREAARKWWWYGGAVLLFVCALLSKSVACAMPVVVLGILWWKKPRMTWGDVGWTVPFFVLGLVAGLHTAFLEVTHVGASGAMWSYGPVERTLLAGRGLWFYAGKIVAPLELAFYYPQWTPDAGAWWQYLYVAGVLGVLGLLFWKREKCGKGPLVAVVLYAAVLFPALGYFNLFPMIFSVTADHFQYLASPALIALVSAVLTMGVRRFLPGREWVGVLLSAVILTPLGAIAYGQCWNYQNATSLWLSVNRVNPHWNAYVGLSAEYMREATALAARGRIDEAHKLADAAIECDLQALKLRPKYDVALYNLGGDYAFKKDYARSIDYYRQAIAVNPNDYRFHQALGKTYAAAGKPKEAAGAYLESLRLNPKNASAHVAMAGLMMDVGDEERTNLYVANALYVDPRNAEAHLLQGFLYAMKNNMTSARAEFEEAVKWDPENVAAADSLAKAIALSPNATPAELQRALALSTKAVEKTGRTRVDYLDTLAIVLNRLGRREEAIAVLKEALGKVPENDAGGRSRLLRRLQRFGAETQTR